MPYVGLTNFVK